MSQTFRVVLRLITTWRYTNGLRYVYQVVQETRDKFPNKLSSLKAHDEEDGNMESYFRKIFSICNYKSKLLASDKLFAKLRYIIFSLKQSSVQFSYSVVSDSLQPNGPGFPVHHQFPELIQFMSIKSMMPSNHFILCWPVLLSPSIFPSIRVYSGESVLLIRWPKYQSFSFRISPSWIFRTDFLQHGLVGSPCCPRDSQESSPTPQFKSINSLALSFLYSSNLTLIHDYWKNHSFDQTDLCWQSSVSAF